MFNDLMITLIFHDVESSYIVLKEVVSGKTE